MEFSLSPNQTPQPASARAGEDALLARGGVGPSLKLLTNIEPTPTELEDNPLSEILSDFRRELAKFIDTDEARSASIGFGPKPSVASLSVERLKAACKNVVQRLEDVATGSAYDPGDKISAAQLQEQVELFGAFLKGNVEQRDVHVEQVAIKMKSMVTQAMVQIEAGPTPQMEMGMLQQLLSGATVPAGAGPMPSGYTEEEPSAEEMDGEEE